VFRPNIAALLKKTTTLEASTKVANSAVGMIRAKTMWVAMTIAIPVVRPEKVQSPP
jgi:hypothetical protein